MTLFDLYGLSAGISRLPHQIPNNDVGIFRATRKPHSGLVEGELRDRCSVSVEGDDHGRRPRVPYPDLAVVISYCENIWVGFGSGE